uniref:Uncharacterized protein n=1 Tax=Panagrolaimus sp. ES5 TaxID=591445 RepID=A0AC34FWX6_9BILA
MLIVLVLFGAIFLNFVAVNGLNQNDTETNIYAKIVEKSYKYSDTKTEGGIHQVEFQDYILRQPHLVPEKARVLFVKPSKEQLSYIEAAKKDLIPFKQLYEKAFDGAAESHRAAILSIRILASF